VSSLQELIDALASELGRPVGIDDRRFRALAYSSHEEEVDQVRRDSILRREAPPAVTEWLASLGIEGAVDYMRVPANAEFGMDGRLCFPLRFEGDILGYLWLIDRPRMEDRRSLAIAGEYAEQLATELARVRRLENAERERQAQLLVALLFGDDPVAAAARLSGQGMLEGARNFAVVLAEVAAGVGPEVGVHLSLAAEEVRRGISSNHALVLAQPHSVILALAFEDLAEPARRGAALLDSCRRHLAGVPTAEVVVAVGARRDEATALGASFGEAKLAAEVGRRVPSIGTEAPVRWDDLGAYRTVARLLGERDAAALLPPALLPLLDEREGLGLIETAETYLDRGGDAQGAATALFLHRSSLYKRLNRIERLTGYDLRNGDDRLELHLGLRLWRLVDGGDSRDSG
jgi:hypothetical protein